MEVGFKASAPAPTFQAEQLDPLHNPAELIASKIPGCFAQPIAGSMPVQWILKVAGAGGELTAYPTDWLVQLGARYHVFANVDFVALFEPSVAPPPAEPEEPPVEPPPEEPPPEGTTP